MDDDVLLLLLIAVLILCVLLFQKIRKFWCWYYKTAAILDKLDEIDRKLKFITAQINQMDQKSIAGTENNTSNDGPVLDSFKDRFRATIKENK